MALLILCALIASPTIAGQSSTPPARKSAGGSAAQESEAVTRGEALFNRHCPICHLGRPSDTRPFVGRNLRGILKNAKPDREAAVRKAIREGNDRMPGFQYNLTPGEIDDVMSYLKSYN